MSCQCENLPLDYRDYTRALIGIDSTKGRYAEVAVEHCSHCKRAWLSYSFEEEGFEKSGRWFRGLIDEGTLKDITPQNAAAYLESLNRYQYGGSYFERSGYSQGAIGS